MARIPFSNIAAIGVVQDMPGHMLPPNAWTKGENVRFLEDSVWKVAGYIQVFEPPSVAPHFLMPVINGADRWWIYAGLTKIYAVLNGVHSNITRQPAGVDVNYGGTITDRWNGFAFGSIPILNNGVDTPQMWTPIGAAQRLQPLAHWPGGVTARVLRPFKEFLVALNVTKAGTNYPTMVKWSHPADPGDVPVSWNETDETVDAGEWPLSETADQIIDALPLGDVNLIYKEESVHGMAFIGGNFVFRFFRVFPSFGLLAQRCAIDLDKKHMVVTPNDILVHDGQNQESAVNVRERRQIFSELSPDNFKNSFLLGHKDSKEIWFCYPERNSGNAYATRAAIWNVAQKAWSFRDLGGFREGDYGQVPTVGTEAWSSDSASWASDSTPWGEDIFGLNRGAMLPDPTGMHLHLLERSRQANGGNYEAILERVEMKFQSDDPRFNSHRTVKQVTNIYPHIKADPGTIVYVTVGFSPRPEADVVWGTPKPFTVGTSEKVDIFMAGKMPAIRYSSSGNDSWKLTGYEMDVNIVGDF